MVYKTELNMKIKVLILLVISTLTSCALDTLSEEVNAYVYYNKAPVNNAKVLTWQGYEKGFVEETKSDSLGFFHLKKLTKYTLGLESRYLAQKFIIKKENLISDTLFTTDFSSIDTISLKNHWK